MQITPALRGTPVTRVTPFPLTEQSKIDEVIFSKRDIITRINNTLQRLPDYVHHSRQANNARSVFRCHELTVTEEQLRRRSLVRTPKASAVLASRAFPKPRDNRSSCLPALSALPVTRALGFHSRAKIFAQDAKARSIPALRGLRRRCDRFEAIQHGARRSDWVT